MFDGPLAEKSEAVKVKYLLLWSGEEGIDVSSTWELTDNESNTLSVYWDRFGKYVAPKSNFRIARFKLRSMKQDNGESVDAYMKTVRILARECKYTDTNEHMLDTLIFGTNSEHVQSKLIQRDETLSLDEAIDIARTEEATKQQLQSLKQGFIWSAALRQCRAHLSKGTPFSATRALVPRYFPPPVP